ncbi:MAG: TorF family putative porin [Burkholderiales bacterium]|nr:TorF family putative porin [Burkholderiales bacterium]
MALAALTLTAGSSVMAQLAYNVGAVSEYRYRGIAQTALAPAVQGGVDYAHSSGFYVGAWGSQIRWIKEAGTAANIETKGDVELDIYGGYKGEISKDFTYDVGYLRYEYVGNTYKDVSTANASTDEAYGALTYGAYTFKVSYAFSNLFGTAKSDGSVYYDLSATYDLGSGYSVVPHVGRQEIAGPGTNKDYSYTDYSVTLAKDLGKGLSATIAAVGTDGKASLYKVNGRQLEAATVVLGVKYTF